MFTFVSGGLRSGKSAYALRRASELGPPPWLYVAAQVEGDDELKTRLASHRRDHDTTWRLIEAPEKMIDVLEPQTLDGAGAVVIKRGTVGVAG
jgi:adenosylcobinamide kinase / adenosylcobinamide-phosphate guanylyltransferase